MTKHIIMYTGQKLAGDLPLFVRYLQRYPLISEVRGTRSGLVIIIIYVTVSKIFPIILSKAQNSIN